MDAPPAKSSPRCEYGLEDFREWRAIYEQQTVRHLELELYFSRLSDPAKI